MSSNYNFQQDLAPCGSKNCKCDENCPVCSKYEGLNYAYEYSNQQANEQVTWTTADSARPLQSITIRPQSNYYSDPRWSQNLRQSRRALEHPAGQDRRAVVYPVAQRNPYTGQLKTSNTAARALQDIRPASVRNNYNYDPRSTQAYDYGQYKMAPEYSTGQRQRVVEYPVAKRDPRQTVRLGLRQPQQSTDAKTVWGDASYERVENKAKGTTVVRMRVQGQWDY